MDDQTTERDHLAGLYRRAFSEFGTEALWNLRPAREQAVLPSTGEGPRYSGNHPLLPTRGAVAGDCSSFSMREDIFSGVSSSLKAARIFIVRSMR